MSMFAMRKIPLSLIKMKEKHFIHFYLPFLQPRNTCEQTCEIRKQFIHGDEFVSITTMHYPSEMSACI